MKKCYLIIPFFLLMFFNNYSQDFGEVSDELLKMTSLVEDPEEDAAVIFDKCTVKITRDFYLETKRHVRIKVFTEEGKKQANIKIVTWHEDDINSIDAISISPDGKEYELDSDNIFEEEGENTRTVSFPVPGVEVGSVFDYEYKIYSKYISHLEPWTFQRDIFTKYSELKVFLKNGFTYQKLGINLDYFDVNESFEQLPDQDDQRYKIALYTWSCSNLSGIKDEPYTDNIDNNYARLYFIMVGFKNEYVNLKFAEDWNIVAEKIYKSYNDLIEDDEFIEMVKKIIGTETDEIKKAIMLYDYVRLNIKTVEHNGLQGEYLKVPEEVLKDKTGSASEKSMLLINLYTQAGLNAKPVWVSTRKNGEIIPGFCDAAQFNRLICLLQIGVKQFFLYPASYYLPFNYLPPYVDVGKGLLIEEEKGEIISISNPQLQNSILINTNGKIDSTNKLKVETQITYNGQSALEQRDALLEKDHETYLKDYLKEKFAEAKLDTFYYTDLDSAYKPLQLNLKFSFENYIEETDQLGYFSLPFFSGLKENPFIRKTRTNPIDFEYPELKTEIIKIELPDNYKVSEVPTKRKKLITGMGFNLVCAAGKNYVECNRTFDIANRKLDKRKYLDIKSLFDEMVSSTNDQVVLTKKIDSTIQ
jgi:hypothetical protein